MKHHDSVTKDLLTRLLVKDPRVRLTDPQEIMNHKFFEDIDWQKMMARQCATPYKPEVTDPLDLCHFDVEQTNQPIETPPSYSDVSMANHALKQHSLFFLR